ncbi:MAG: hypothetical protein PHU40_03545 [Sulfurimonas sp.]|jgi:hypothetical protein|nr:hypothetical protein [Sulfurimonas sp.]
MKKILLATALCATLIHAADVLPVEKRTFEQSKYIPDISLVMDASYVSRSVSDDAIAHLEVPGVVHGLLGSHAHGEHAHSTYNAENGFNLNYAELVLSSSVDPFFTMDGIFHFSPNGVAIEELYFTSTALGNGLRAKGGKFNSNFGYLNEQHHHAWDFADMPLVYEAFLGMHGINETGLQIQWTAPTSTYLMFGAEVLQGDNEQMFGNSTIDLTAINAAADPAQAEYEKAPSMFVGYIKTSFDIEDTTILAGLSYAQGSSRIDHTEDDENKHAFSGDSKLYGADLVIKHSFDSYSSLKWQSEYLYRDMDGVQYANNVSDVFVSPDMAKKQAGLYSQLIYAYDRSWRTGIRYDAFIQNDVEKDGVTVAQPSGLEKYSVMAEYSTSEFARFRLQYDHNNAMFDEAGQRQSIDSVILQANISIGAHGAHSF